MFGETTTSTVEAVATQAIDAIWKVYEQLGPGLLESANEVCLEFELVRRGLNVRRQVVVPIVNDGVELDAMFRIDLLVNECLVIELKAVEKLMPVHDAQVLTYLKLSRLPLGILVNFNARYLKDQLKRIVLSNVS